MARYLEWINMDPNDAIPKNVGEVAQILIASELAEANRLKRIELAIKVVTLDKLTIDSISEEIGEKLSLEEDTGEQDG